MWIKTSIVWNFPWFPILHAKHNGCVLCTNYEYPIDIISLYQLESVSVVCVSVFSKHHLLLVQKHWNLSGLLSFCLHHCKYKSFQVHFSGIVHQRYNYPQNEYFQCKYSLIISVNEDFIKTFLRFLMFANWQDVLSHFNLVSCYTEF